MTLSHDGAKPLASAASQPKAAAKVHKPYKSVPPENTLEEAGYLKSLGEQQTPVEVKLCTGERVRGWIEYYDAGMLRITREGEPNLFIYKSDIAYVTELESPAQSNPKPAENAA